MGHAFPSDPGSGAPGRLFRRALGTLAGLAIALTLGAAGQAHAQLRADEGPLARTPACPTRPYRWQEDCRSLAGHELGGLDAWRYRPLTADGDVWLTLGGEARVRMDLLHDADFGIGGAPAYTEVAGRLLAHADLRSRAGPRAFIQLAVVQQTGRRPNVRPQDESAIDVAQAFVDAPLKVGDATITARVGRQEIDLSGNRLVASRDGVTLRRAFEGAKVDVVLGGAKLAILSVRPMDLRDDPFADRADRTERFNAVALDLPPALSPGGGLLNLYFLDRDRSDARWLRAQGNERRYSFGVRYVGQAGGWRIETQATGQTGRVAGKPIRAYGAALSLDREFAPDRPVAIGFDLVAASGDKAGTRRIETFDPVYPNNFGLSDAPLFFQTNYVFGGGSLSTRWAGAVWTAGANLLVRHSTSDAVYASGRPIPAAFGTERLTSLLSQVSVRRPIARNYEVYASLVQAQALGALRGAGGRTALYSRVQFTARF